MSLARAFIAGGARCLQVRAKRLGSGRFLELCDAVVDVAATSGAVLIVNDRADLSLLSGAAGVHVGQGDLRPSDVRRILGPDAVVGWSTHSATQIEEASRVDLSYIAVGPVFDTHTKETGYQAVGLGLVSEAARRSRGRPVVAIGGVTLETAPTLIAAGAAGVAVISDLLVGGNPAARTAAYVRALGDWTPQSGMS